MGGLGEGDEEGDWGGGLGEVEATVVEAGGEGVGSDDAGGAFGRGGHYGECAATTGYNMLFIKSVAHVAHCHAEIDFDYRRQRVGVGLNHHHIHA